MKKAISNQLIQIGKLLFITISIALIPIYLFFIWFICVDILHFNLLAFSFVLILILITLFFLWKFLIKPKHPIHPLYLLLSIPLILIFLYIDFYYIVETYDYSDSFYLPEENCYVLESMELKDDNQSIAFKDFKPHFRGEFREFREQSFTSTQENIVIQYRTDKPFNIYLNNYRHDFLEEIDLENIKMHFNGINIDSFEIVSSNDGSLKIRMVKFPQLVVNEDDIKNKNKLELSIPFKNSSTLFVQFDYGQYNTIRFMPSGRFHKPENVLEWIFLRWVLGVEYNENVINNNLSF